MKSNLGKVVSVKVPRAKQETIVYVKSKPTEQSQELIQKLDLPMQLPKYEERYGTPPPLAITENIQKQLVEKHHVEPDCFN